MDSPNLIDPAGFYNIKRYLEKQHSNTKQIGGFFDFLGDKNRDNLRIIFIIVFFLLIVLFLYYRYQQKKMTNKQEKINEFLDSVTNYLNIS
jgi:hypothetical protein